MIYGSDIIELLDRMIGVTQYRWQKDNAPAHNRSRESSEFLAKMTFTDWTAKNPDLSPMEYVWTCLKTKTIGIMFANPDALFAFLAEEWSKIPSEMIERFWGSFHARLQVCAAHGGACLNGHWKEGDRLHHPGKHEEELEITEQSHNEEEDKVEGDESD
jgi:hypothetical protein